MKSQHLQLFMKQVPQNFTRGKHVLIVLENSQGKLLLGHKSAYPPGIYRFVGGGIEGDETPLEAAIREVAEEVQIGLEPDRLTPLAEVSADIETETENFHFMTYVFFAKIGNQIPQPSDDLEGVVEVTREELAKLADMYLSLSPELVEINPEGGQKFRWLDYGRYYGEVHKIALEEILELEEKLK